jgi:V/A-type H+/Na+-transporting ATPase subunit E
MSEKLKELLNKINREGVKQAEEKAKDIESKAGAGAEKIIKDANGRALKIVEKANEEAAKIKESSEAALKQAARDLTLSLKEEIKNIFNKIISAETGKTLSFENVSVIVTKLIEGYVKNNGDVSDIKVLLKEEDLPRFQKYFLEKLKEKLKSGMEFKPSPNINAGFSISFDKGKSFFDFTDEGVAEALSVYLNPEVSKLFQ